MTDGVLTTTGLSASLINDGTSFSITATGGHVLYQSKLSATYSGDSKIWINAGIESCTPPPQPSVS